MDNTIDLQFVEYIVKSLVGNPDAVKIARTIDEKGVLLELTVDPEDLGRVIGKRGATAQSLRTLLRALGTKNDARYNLKIVDNGEPRPPREDRQDDRQQEEGRRDERSDSRSDNRREERRDDNHRQEDEQPGSSDKNTTEEVKRTPSAPVEDAWSSSAAPAIAAKEVEEHSDAISKTRKELNDLDDLDI